MRCSLGIGRSRQLTLRDRVFTLADMTALIRASGIRGYEDLVVSLGADPGPLLLRFDLTSEMLADDDALVSLRSVMALLEASAAATGHHDFGLRMAQHQGIDILGPLALGMQHSPTVADALQFASRYLFVHSPGLVFSVLPNSALVPDACELRLQIQLPRQPAQRQAIDQCLAVLYRILRFLAPQEPPLLTVALPHRPIAPLSAYARFFGAPIRVEQEHGGLHVLPATLNATLRAVNGSLRKMASDYIAQQYSDPAQTLTQRVRHALMRTLSTSQGRKEAIAEMLAMHPRTMQRRLSAEQCSFEDLREDVRKEVALRYLRDTRVPLSQLSSLLGLSEQSALTRSCRRWFGTTPARLRTAHLAKAC